VSATVIDLAERRLQRALEAAGLPAILVDQVEIREVAGLRRGDRVELPDGSRGTLASLELCSDGRVLAYVLQQFANRIIGADRLRRLPPQQANAVRPTPEA
jgi:hypothetical protein